MDPQDFGFLDPDPEKYANPRDKYQPKTAKKNFTPKTQFLTFDKKEMIKISSFLNGSWSFWIKISEKNKQKIWKLFFVKKIQ